MRVTNLRRKGTPPLGRGICCAMLLVVLAAVPGRGLCGVNGEDVLLRIRFAKGETALDDRARDEIKMKLPVLRAFPASRLVVGGCPSGAEPAALHDARCRAVRDFLRLQRLDPLRIRIASTCRVKRDSAPAGGETITVVRE